MLHWDLEELQEAVSSDSQSEVSDLLSTEEGYEADSEREKEGICSGMSCRTAQLVAVRRRILSLFIRCPGLLQPTLILT